MAVLAFKENIKFAEETVNYWRKIKELHRLQLFYTVSFKSLKVMLSSERYGLHGAMLFGSGVNKK